MTTGGNTQAIVQMSPAACAKISASKIGKKNTTRRARTQETDAPIVEAFKGMKSRKQIALEFNISSTKVQKALVRWKSRVDPELKIGKEFRAVQTGTSLKMRADELNKPIIDALLNGKSRKQVMSDFGVNYARVKQVVQRFRKRSIEEGREVPDALKDKTQHIVASVDERDAPIVSLFQTGMKRREIATKLNITYDAVKQAIVRHDRRQKENV